MGSLSFLLAYVYACLPFYACPGYLYASLPLLLRCLPATALPAAYCAACRLLAACFRGAFAGFAAVSRRFRAASHIAQWCLCKDSQPFRKVSQLRIRVTSSLPVGFPKRFYTHSNRCIHLAGVLGR